MDLSPNLIKFGIHILLTDRNIIVKIRVKLQPPSWKMAADLVGLITFRENSIKIRQNEMKFDTNILLAYLNIIAKIS